MTDRSEYQPTLGWGCTSTTSLSPSSSPLSSNLSLSSPVPRQSLPVSSLLNDGTSSDEDAWTLPSSPHTSRMSTPSDSGSNFRSEVHQRVTVTLPGFDQIARLADSNSTPSAASPAKHTTSSSALHPSLPTPWPGVHHHQRTQVPTRLLSPPPLHQFHSRNIPRQQQQQQQQQQKQQHYAARDSACRIQKKQRKPPTYPPGYTRNNRKYTTEQIDFVLYLRVDKKLGWQEIISSYERHFRSEGNRTTSGLQGSFYRENHSVPVVDQFGDLMFDDDGEMLVRTCKVRDPEGKSIGLLDRYPHRAIEYAWVDREDKKRVWNRGRRHRERLALRDARHKHRRAASPYMGGLPPAAGPSPFINSVSSSAM